jgi:hypothetical protein
VNEKLTLESTLDLTLTQHFRDEDPEIWEVRAHFEVDPPWVWYYRISLNSHTLVILLQVDLISGDEFETVYEGYYKLKTPLFLHGLIHWLLLINKANYLVRTIQCILNFLQLWIIIMV